MRFKICKHRASKNVDPTGYEKYRKSEGKWVFDDLLNNVIVEVHETKEVVMIRAFSSA